MYARKKFFRSATSIVLLFTVLLSSCGRELRSLGDYEKTQSLTGLPAGIMNENERFILLWDDSVQSVFLQDKQTNKIWSNVPYDYYASGETGGGDVQLYSAITIQYIEPVNRQLKTMESQFGTTGSTGRALCNTIDNGIQITYCFDRLEIAVPVQYLLREDSMEIRILIDQIVERENRLFQIAISPFWAAVKNETESGYLFVPSGSGALMDTHVTGVERKYDEEVYGTDPVTLSTEMPKHTQTIRLPVYGATDGEHGILAIIEDGAEMARIQATAGDDYLGYSGVNCAFRVRGESVHYMPAPYSKSSAAYVYSQQILPKSSVSVVYYPLSGENAGYVGMAQRYRTYLQESEGLSYTIAQPSSLFLEFFGGVQSRTSILGFPYDKLRAVTTFQQVKSILQDLPGMDKTAVKLTGFGTSGLNPGKVAGGFVFGSVFGSLNDYKSLASYSRDNGFDLYTDFDLVYYDQSSSGFNSYFNAARTAGGVRANQYFYSPQTFGRQENTDKYYLLGRGELLQASDKLLKSAQKLGTSGVSFSTLGNVAYSDYTDEASAVKTNMGKQVKEIFTSFKNSGHRILTEEANAYAAVLSDCIMGSPVQSSQYDIFYEDVPFYQIVFRGTTSLSGSAINLTTDRRTALLRSVETGCGLYWCLTATSDLRLSGTVFGGLAACVWTDNEAELLAAIEETSGFYDAVEGGHILAHTKLAEGVYETRFDTDVTVWVNYTNSKVQTPGGTIAAKGFTFRKGE